MTIEVILADDHPMVRDGLRVVLAGDPFVSPAAEEPGVEFGRVEFTRVP